MGRRSIETFTSLGPEKCFEEVTLKLTPKKDRARVGEEKKKGRGGKETYAKTKPQERRTAQDGCSVMSELGTSTGGCWRSFSFFSLAGLTSFQV